MTVVRLRDCVIRIRRLRKGGWVYSRYRGLGKGKNNLKTGEEVKSEEWGELSAAELLSSGESGERYLGSTLSEDSHEVENRVSEYDLSNCTALRGR